MKLKIGYRTWVVEFNGGADLVDEERWGDCSERLGVIRVCSHGRSPDAQAETLIHEIMHALIYDAGTEWDGDVQEEVCRVLAPRLAAFVRDNPGPMERIAEMLT